MSERAGEKGQGEREQAASFVLCHEKEAKVIIPVIEVILLEGGIRSEERGRGKSRAGCPSCPHCTMDRTSVTRRKVGIV